MKEWENSKIKPICKTWASKKPISWKRSKNWRASLKLIELKRLDCVKCVTWMSLRPLRIKTSCSICSSPKSTKQSIADRRMIALLSISPRILHSLRTMMLRCQEKWTIIFKWRKLLSKRHSILNSWIRNNVKLITSNNLTCKYKWNKRTQD